MSDALDLMSDGSGGRGSRSGGGRRRAERPPRAPWGRRVLALIVIAAVVLGGWWGYGKVKDFFGGPEDYSGEGSGQVVVEIPEGSTGQNIANILADADVVKSAEAFYQLSLKDSRAQAIQAGFYQLKKQMSAEAALTALMDKGNRVEAKVTIPEGARVRQIVKSIAKNTDITEKEVTAVLENPDALGLPAAADGNPEGYLYPATYVVPPGTTAEELLKQMVAKTVEVTESLDLDQRAKALGLSTEEVLTIASILEYEANRDEDYPKVARVIYNRINQGMALQLDSTVTYVSGREGDVWTTEEERANKSEYNTYEHVGLPPGPIGSPGEKTIEAALNPADGDWLYFVPDYENKTTVFSTNLADHQAAVDRLTAWCRSDKDKDDIC